MQTQAKILEEKISESGWQIVEKLEMPEWWADEIWKLESIWTPIGHSAWITFLVDPENDDTARKKANMSGPSPFPPKEMPTVVLKTLRIQCR